MYITLFAYIQSPPLGVGRPPEGLAPAGAARGWSSVGGSGGDGDGNVTMSVNKQMDCIWQDIMLVVNARQTVLAQDANGDSVVSQTKRTKPACHPGPVTENVQVLFVGHVCFRQALGLAILRRR